MKINTFDYTLGFYIQIMNNRFLLYLAITIVCSFGFTPVFSQTWEELMKMASKYTAHQNIGKANEYAELAFQMAEKRFEPTDKRYKEALDLYAKSTIGVLKRVGDEKKPYYNAVIKEFGKLYARTGDRWTSDSLIRLSYIDRDNPQNRSLSKVDLKRSNEYYWQGNFELALGYTEFAVGKVKIDNYDFVEPILKQALKIKKKALGENNPEYARSLEDLAELYQSISNYAAAEPLLIHALGIRRMGQGYDQATYTKSLNNLAALYGRMGKESAAVPLLKQALDIQKKIVGEEHVNYAKQLDYLARVFGNMGNFNEAEPLLRLALKIRKKVLGVEHPLYATSLNNLAALYFKMQNFAAAGPILIEAMEVRKNALGKKHPDYAASLNNLAWYYYSTSDLAASMALYKQALKSTKRATGKKHPDYAASLNNLALLYQATGKPEKAERLIIEANSILMSQLKLGYQCLSEEESQLFYSSVGNEFEATNSFVSDWNKINPSLSEISLNNELAFKGASLQSAIRMRQFVLESGNPFLMVTFNRWTGIKEQINDLYNQPSAKTNSTLKSLEEVANNLEKELISSSQAFGKMKASLDIQWTDVQKALSGNEAAIEFISFRYDSGKHFTDNKLYAALIVRPGYRYPQFISLFGEKQLQSVLYYTDGPNDRLIRKSITPEILQQLYDLTWKPMEQYLQGVTSVFLSPSGLLTSVPFQALIKDKSTCLIDLMEINYLLSTRELALNKTQQETIGPLIADLFGGIQYDLDTLYMILEARLGGGIVKRGYVQENVNRGISSFQYLQGTLTEVNKINGYLTSHDWKTRVFTDKKATEGQFKRLSGTNAPAILHIATHGFYFPPRNSSGKDLVQSGSGSTFRLADNPLRRTGLIMAGGNLAWKGMPIPDGVEDGILTAYEISNMDLRKTGLVVLSACETGLGDIKRGEGVFGLQRAFRLAGVKTIIMSLWNVDDKTTTELMSLYFQNWMKGESRVDAFNGAVSELRKSYPDEPARWAAFVMVDGIR
jgi:CHAT domain-containing protein